MTNANDAKKKGKETISHEYNSEQNQDTQIERYKLQESNNLPDLNCQSIIGESAENRLVSRSINRRRATPNSDSDFFSMATRHAIKPKSRSTFTASEHHSMGGTGSKRLLAWRHLGRQIRRDEP